MMFKIIVIYIDEIIYWYRSGTICDSFPLGSSPSFTRRVQWLLKPFYYVSCLPQIFIQALNLYAHRVIYGLLSDVFAVNFYIYMQKRFSGLRWAMLQGIRRQSEALDYLQWATLLQFGFRTLHDHTQPTPCPCSCCQNL